MEVGLKGVSKCELVRRGVGYLNPFITFNAKFCLFNKKEEKIVRCICGLTL